MSKQIERIVNADRVEDLITVFGSFDENIRRIEEALSVTIVNRGTELKVTGDEESVDLGVKTLEGLLTLAAKGEMIDEQKLRNADPRIPGSLRRLCAADDVVLE